MHTFHVKHRDKGFIEKHWSFYKMLATSDLSCYQVLGVSTVLSALFCAFRGNEIKNWCKKTVW